MRLTSRNSLSVEAMEMKLEEIYSTSKNISLEVSNMEREVGNDYFRTAAILDSTIFLADSNLDKPIKKFT